MASSVPVELRLAGAFGVFRGGVELSEEQVGSRKARMLLKLLAVEQLARQAGQAGLSQDIMERTRGHTLFVAEVLRALAAGVPGVPESLRNAVLARVRRTGAASEALPRAAALLGAALDPFVLATLLDLAPAVTIELRAVALEARLVVVSGRDPAGGHRRRVHQVPARR